MKGQSHKNRKELGQTQNSCYGPKQKPTATKRREKKHNRDSADNGSSNNGGDESNGGKLGEKYRGKDNNDLLDVQNSLDDREQG